ncbi:AAA family ATPase [Fusibacter sp. 3D3]|uniref:AAA family ATPase n=1 Tax=Fusibacter sp. 3D3 TaxID=1048380 RepID=UPI000853369D|nr:AAA family ATPase [Fusibacter sp. 3D3]GAU76532.1 predicted ATP-binding protein involved in virulence [Fusibacter sp. 3D3]
MKLVYIWIDKFRNFEREGISFLNNGKYFYDKATHRFNIVANIKSVCIYPEYISGINAVVGANGVGKTNLIDLISLRKLDRNKQNEEFEVIYKPRKGSKFKKPEDLQRVDKNSAYFFVYEYGEDNGEALYCVEGNDIERFKEIFHGGQTIEEEYWKEKYWFSFICKYVDGQFEYQYNTNIKLGEYKIGKFEGDGIRITGDYREEQGKRCIISFREKLNPKYYDRRSQEFDDETYIMIPRRVATFRSNLVSSQFRFLNSYLKNKDRKLFKDKNYYLRIYYGDEWELDLKYMGQKELELISFEGLENNKDINALTILDAFVKKFFYHIIDRDNKEPEYIEKIIKCKTDLESISSVEKTFDRYKPYYRTLIGIICEFFVEEKEDRRHIYGAYEDLVDSMLKAYEQIEFYKDYFEINVGDADNIGAVIALLNKSVDEKKYSSMNKNFTVYGDFFSHAFERLSDGENALLGMYASLYEQLNTLTGSRESYILLLDEPEMRMHPELSRNFINDLILFLGDIRTEGVVYQIIISTHSPFILTDVKSDGIVYLERFGEVTHVKSDVEIMPFGQNIHTLLSKGFFMKATMGAYAKDFINRLIDEIKSIQGSEKEMSDEDFSLYQLEINLIGEELIRNKLLQLLETVYYRNIKNVNKELERLEAEKERLESKMNILKERKNYDSTSNS